MHERGRAEQPLLPALELLTVRLRSCRRAAQRGALTPGHVARLEQAARRLRRADHRVGSDTTERARVVRLRRTIDGQLAQLCALRGSGEPWAQALLTDASIDVAEDTLRSLRHTEGSTPAR